LEGAELEAAKTRPVRNYTLLEEVIRYRPIQSLFENSRKELEREIEIFAAPASSLPLGFDARTFSVMNGNIQIFIRAAVNKQTAIKVLIQELANISIVEEVKRLYQSAREGGIDAEHFVEKIETLEFNASQIYESTLRQLIKENRVIWRSFPHAHATFQQYKDVQKASGHSKLYFDVWDRLHKNYANPGQ